MSVTAKPVQWEVSCTNCGEDHVTYDQAIIESEKCPRCGWNGAGDPPSRECPTCGSDDVEEDGLAWVEQDPEPAGSCPDRWHNGSGGVSQ